MAKKSNIKNIYNLSPMQEGMLFHALKEKDSAAYVEQVVMTLEGEVDAARFKETFQALLNRYDVLRTVFVYKSTKQPRQVVLKKREAVFLYEDLSQSADQSECIQRFRQEELGRGFHLGKEVLMRLGLFKTAAKKYILVWTYHHILMDGWCLGLLFKDFAMLYPFKSLPLEPVIPFSRYIKWLDQQDRDRGLQFWRDYLHGYDTLVSLPVSDNTPATGYRLQRYKWHLDKQLTANMTTCAQQAQVTMNVLLQTSWGILLQKYNLLKDVVFGAVVSGRPPGVPGVESIVGLFINTVPVRITTEPGASFGQLLKQAGDIALSAQSYEYLSLAEIQAVWQADCQLLDHILVLENYPLQQNLASMGKNNPTGFRVIETRMHEQTGYNFNCIIVPGSRLEVEFSFNEEVYDLEFMEQVAEHYSLILRQVTADPHIAVNRIQFITDSQREKLLCHLSGEQADYPIHKTAIQLFAENLKTQPHTIALCCADQSLTYAALDDASSRTADTLKTEGVTPGDIVAIMQEPGIDLIITILAILKCGAAYLPIHHDTPGHRVNYILEDSNAVLLVLPEAYRSYRIYRSYKPADQPVNTDAAYIIYTSGSTGRPKGVSVSHGSLINFVFSLDRAYNNSFSRRSRTLNITSIGFDVSVCEIFTPLLLGGTLVILPEARRWDSAQLTAALIRETITFTYLPPALLEEVYRHLWLTGTTIALNKLLVGVEPIPDTVLSNYLKLNPSMRIINAYGPTEATICATFYPCQPSLTGNPVPIGRPIDNSSILLLDPDGNLVPPGLPGEICITGLPLALGYLNNPRQTAESFCPIHYKSNRAYMSYKSGDLARWLPDGNLKFLGRGDNQVKVRGYRIELGEIENRLKSHPLVKDTVVTGINDQTGREKVLCAYISSESATGGDLIDQLQKFLFEQLPKYMVPSYFISMPHIPRTANGKPDYKALPMPGESVSPRQPIPPMDPLQEKIARIWCETLNRDLHQLSMDDNFFQCGGHSLKAMSMVARANKELELQLTLPMVFENPTIQSLSAAWKAESAGDPGLQPVEEREYYPQAPAQKRLFFIHCMGGTGTAYNIPFSIELEGDLDIGALNTVFKQLIQRHPALRTSFHRVNEEAVQRIHPMDSIDFSISLQSPSKTKSSQAHMAKFVQPFEPGNPPLLRVGLVKIAPRQHLLMVDIHHIIADGTSCGLLMKEFMQLYNGETLIIPETRYVDFACWKGRDGSPEARSFWLDQFKGEIPVLHLPLDFPRPLLQDFDGQTLNVTLDETITASLEQLAVQQEATLFMVILALYHILLAKFSGQNDIVVGVPVAGRSQPGLETVVGMFVNTLPLRNVLTEEMPFASFLAVLKENTLQAFQHQQFPLEQLIEVVKIRRDASRNPLFDVSLVFHNMDMPELKISPGQLKQKTVTFNKGKIKNDLNLEFRHSRGCLSFNVQYSTSLFKKSTIQRMMAALQLIIRQVTADSQVNPISIDILPEREKSRIMSFANGPVRPIKNFVTIHSLIEEQVQITPHRVAVCFANEYCITYRELNHQADHAAEDLQVQGIGKGNVVAVMMARSIARIIAMLAVMKAGAVYLPIDPNYPQARKDFIFKDSSAVSYASYRTYKGCCADRGAAPVKKNCAAGGDAAYIIYTSGSTGRPKGVVVKHQGLVSLQNYFKKELGTVVADRVSQFFSSSFDASLWETFTALFNGAVLCVPAAGVVQDYRLFQEYLYRNAVTVVNGPPMYIAYLDRNKLPAMHTVITGGSQANIDVLKQWRDHALVVNAYGPTEASIGATAWESLSGEINGVIPIGKPLPNFRLYILDHTLWHLQPIGVAGELCIAGPGLALGYLNRPELTHERFIRHKTLNERIYCTGDLVRWLEDGNILFLGRVDDQVKVRGFRIEPGEIQQQIKSFSWVRDVVVMAHRDERGDNYLCAYVVPAQGAEKLWLEGLKDQLKSSLPGYMVPGYFIELTEIPLTINGKPDTSALPLPGNTEGQRDVVPPQNPLQKKLAGIWQDVLVDSTSSRSIGIDDDFFEAGGHSLKAVTLVTRLQKEMMVDIPVGQIFLAPTIRQLAAYIAGLKTKQFRGIKKTELREYYPQSSAQKRLFLLDRFQESRTSYNMPMVLELRGIVDMDRVLAAFEGLITRHESLRTSFQMMDDHQPVQRVHDLDIIKFKLEQTDHNDITHFVRPFDLGRAPLLRAGLRRLKDKDWLLMVDMHHIICDGTSMGILVDDWVKFYDGLFRVENTPEIQYKDFSMWQNRLIASGELQTQLDYWINVLHPVEDIPRLNLVTDFPRPAVFNFQGQRLRFDLDAQTSEGIGKFARANGATHYMVMATALTILLYRCTGMQDIITATSVAGRSHADLLDIMGMFINSLLLRSFPQPHKPCTQLMLEIKESSIAGLENQDLQFEELVEQLNPVRDTSRNPIFDVMLVVQNFRQPHNKLKSLTVSSLQAKNNTAKFDMTFLVEQQPKGIAVTIEYYSAVFKQETIEHLAALYRNILLQMIAVPDSALMDLEIISPEEKQRILYEFNHTDAPVSPAHSIQQLVEEQALRSPHHVAAYSPDEGYISYRELNQWADKHACQLSRQGLGPGMVAAFQMEQSLQLLIEILGILKTGACFLPIDINCPQQRKDFFLKDSSAGRSAAPVIKNGEAGRAAYIIYTSGSTGRPKGVMVGHGALINLCTWHNHNYGVTPRDHASKYASVAFDASVWEMFPYLVAGACLYIVPPDIKNQMLRLNDFFHQHDITIGFLPTQACEQFMDMAPHNRSLRIMLTGGDRLRKFNKTNYKLYNNYGPTENTVVTTSFLVDSHTHNIPIGKPIDNSKIYIRGSHGQLQPIGVAGELMVTGTQLAMGYLNNPEQTAEKFGLHHSEYKTGDLACWLPDGNIRFLGRIDRQVKVRGFRIELGEIENCLLRHQQVREAVVVDWQQDDGETFLCAYILPDPKCDANIIKKYLKRLLPDYMVPPFVIILEKIPFNPSGKVDRKQLTPPLTNKTSLSARIAPRTAVEKQMARIWADVLNVPVEHIGIDDNFFNLGGHSLKAARIFGRIEKEMNLHIPMRHFFNFPTIRQLIPDSPLTHTSMETVTSTEKREFYPLSFSQERVWDFMRRFPNSTAYQVTGRIDMNHQVDENMVRRALEKLFSRHESFKTRFCLVEGRPVQMIRADCAVPVPLEVKDMSALKNPLGEVDRMAEQFIKRPFDLGCAPLFRAMLLKLDQGSWQFVYVMQHIVTDGWSQEILKKEFLMFYNNTLEGKEREPLPHVLQNRDVAVWLRTRASEDRIMAEVDDYWQQKLEKGIGDVRLPFDFQPENVDIEHKSVTFHSFLDLQKKEHLTELTGKYGTSLFIILFAAYNILLSRISGQSDIVSRVASALRQQQETQSIVGYMVNHVIVNCRVDLNEPFSELVQQVINTTNEDFYYQWFQLEEVMKRRNKPYPLISATFNMLSIMEGATQTELKETEPFAQEDLLETKFPLVLSVLEFKNGIKLLWQFKKALFKPDTIIQIDHQFHQIISRLQ